MLNLPENFCVAPFLQYTTHPSGSGSPCPYLGGTVWNEDGDILERWRGSGLTDLRQKFLNNEKSPICNRCWHEEDHGKISLRQRMFDPVTNAGMHERVTQELIEKKLCNDEYLHGPTILTLKNGNVCNAKCRSCHPIDSSRWNEDSVKVYSETSYEYYGFNESIEVNWSQEQLDQILSLSKNLVRIELFGGEPTYNKQVRRLLDAIASQDYAKDLDIYVNTNGQVNLPDHWPFLDKFRSVEVGLSLDGVGNQFNYIRHGVSWDQVRKNIRSLQQFLLKNRLKISLTSISTVSVLNVYYLPELRKEVKRLLGTEPFWNILLRPPHLFIRHIPDAVKPMIVDKLKADGDYADIISILSQPSDDYEWQSFVAITESLDRIRGESFTKTFPEFADLLAAHGKGIRT